MRVLQILNSPEPGGVLSLAASIANGLQRHGITVETVYITPQVGMSALAKARGCLSVARRIARGRYGGVVAYQGSATITLALTGLLVRGPRRIVHQTTVPRSTSTSVRVIDRIIGSLGLYSANVVNTAFTKSEFDAYPDRYRRGLVLIEHGVEAPVMTRSRADKLAQYGLPTNAPILLNTGRLVSQKNQQVLTNCLPQVPGAHLVIAGGGDLGSSYRDLAKQVGVADRLHLLGALPFEEAVELYGIADLFVFPSVHETFGISGVEAVMLGLPAVVSDIPVFREVLSIDGRSAVDFVDHADPAAWATAINRALATPADPEKLDGFAQEMRRKYSEERMVGGYLRLLGVS